MKIIKTIFTILLVLVAIDIVILMATMAQIAIGEPTPHIPFWDAQIAFVTKLLLLISPYPFNYY